MAETVKKSRIVSEADENLEESLLEEFNLRLKKCMSRDDLQAETEAKADLHVYENIEIIKTNGAAPAMNHQPHTTPSQEFLNSERTHYDQNGCGITSNGHHDAGKPADVDNFENLELETCSLEKFASKSTKTDSNLDQSVCETDAAIQKPSLNLPTTCLIDAAEPCEAENPDAKSVKDRMFLSTDDASCLLFTQTVTSPMLTPSEENIDFLKGFRRGSSQNTLSDSTNSSNSPKSEPKVDECNGNGVVKENLPEVTNEPKETIYENTNFLKGLENEKRIDQNFEEAVENIEQPPVEDLYVKQIADVKEETSKFIESEISCAVSNQSFEVENQEVVTDLDAPQENPMEDADEIIQKVIETSISNKKETAEIRTESVKALKTHFMKSDGDEPLKSPRLETSDELNELKSLNIMKQINKFESTTSESQEVTNVCSNSSVSTVTESSHFVQTTTEMRSTGDMNNMNMKKKKSKKSKNQHEKENISVNETNTNEEESFYNVNVKSLCRSFGDLTKIEGEQYRNWKNTERSRTKSMCDVRTLEVNKNIDNVFGGVSVKALRDRYNVINVHTNSGMLSIVKRPEYSAKIEQLKSSFSKFDALQKKNVLNSQSSLDNGNDASNCKKCGKPVFQMERVIAERYVWHRNCFRCIECSKQLLVDNFESHDGTLYCKPHFRALFAPKAVEDDAPSKPRKHEVIIRENQPAELPPDVVRASDKPDLGLEELHSLNVKERFQVFENAKTANDYQMEKNTVKMERSPSILSKLARFQAKGMNVGVTDDSLNGVPVEISDSEEEEEEEIIDGDDADLIRAKRVQKEKPFHFSQMSDVKSKWEQGNPAARRDDLREERKQEIQNIRSRLFMGKQGKMKEAYQQAIAESELCANLKKEVPLEAADTRSIKDRFEKGEINNEHVQREAEDMSMFESGLSKQSRSLFQELDASGGMPPKVSPSSPPKLGNSVRNAREAYLAKQASEDTVRSSDQVDEVTVRTADIQDRFKFFETYKEPQQKRREFRMTPPREGQTKSKTPEREVYIDPDIVRSDEYIEDSVVAKATHTATKMLNKFRQMEENLSKNQDPQGPKPLKRFTPPREPLRRESSSEEESGSEEESEEEVNNRMPERDLLEAQKAARAKQLKAKFEHWEENEVRRDSSVNLSDEIGDDQSQIETARSLRAKFESLRETNNGQRQSSRVKVNRFVEATCSSCSRKVYPLEMVSIHGHTFHRSCFRCKECNAVLRMDTYSYNQGLLYCTTHFKRLFIAKGNYDTAFGLEQHKEKWNITTMA